MLSGLFSILCMLRLFAAQLRARHFPSDLRIDKSAMAVHLFIADRALRASVQAAETEGTLGEPEGRLPFLHHDRAVGALCGAKGTPDARIGVYREIFGSPRGAIVNVSSSASLCALPGCAAYSASKAASRAFTEALASEYRGRLYITSVCPGFTKTPIFDLQKPEIEKFLRFSASPEQMAKKILSGIRRGQSLIVRGADAHAMSAVYRIAGTAGEGLCASILRIFGGTAFSECFEKTE